MAETKLVDRKLSDQQSLTQTKSIQHKLIGGVCTNLAHYTPVPTWIWRGLFIISTVSISIGLSQFSLKTTPFAIIPIAIYLLLWMMLPKRR